MSNGQTYIYNDTLLKMGPPPFPLPRAPQQCYTKWYNQSVESGVLKNFTILWVGSQLNCRFKSESINDNIGPHNVFILKKNDQFAYAVIDNTDSIYRLPKKFFTTCFPGVQYNSIPKDNRIKIKLGRNNTIEVPYIPKSFLIQKRRKTTRTKRKRSISVDNDDNRIEQINFNNSYPQWHVLNNNQSSNTPVKQEILILIRHMIMYADSHEEYNIQNPFNNVTSIEDIKQDEHKLKILKDVTGFIYHFCRSELGISILPNNLSTDLQTWIGCLNNIATV